MVSRRGYYSTEPHRARGASDAAFLADVGEWQQLVDVTPTVTALVGSSQGAIMSLEASVTPSSPAGRVVAIGGRFARLPEHAPSRTTIHLVHGTEDPVIPYRQAVDAALGCVGLVAM